MVYPPLRGPPRKASYAREYRSPREGQDHAACQLPCCDDALLPPVHSGAIGGTVGGTIGGTWHGSSSLPRPAARASPKLAAAASPKLVGADSPKLASRGSPKLVATASPQPSPAQDPLSPLEPCAHGAELRPEDEEGEIYLVGISDDECGDDHGDSEEDSAGGVQPTNVDGDELSQVMLSPLIQELNPFSASPLLDGDAPPAAVAIHREITPAFGGGSDVGEAGASHQGEVLYDKMHADDLLSRMRDLICKLQQKKPMTITQLEAQPEELLSRLAHYQALLREKGSVVRG